MAHDDYRPRDHDHLVEPLLGAFAGESASEPRAPRRLPSPRRAAVLLSVLLLIVLLAAAIRWLGFEST